MKKGFEAGPGSVTAPVVADEEPLPHAVAQIIRILDEWAEEEEQSEKKPPPKKDRRSRREPPPKVQRAIID